MSINQNLLKQIASARADFIASISGLNSQQSLYKSSNEKWNILEITEHMFWAEFGGINGMYKAVEGIRNGQPIFTGDKVHHGLAIETIIEQTWKEKEEVPEIAKPRWGGALAFWIHALESCQAQLEFFCNTINDLDPEEIIHPHIISGPLNVLQRLEFLRFHLKRHQLQVENIKKEKLFPLA